MWRGGNDAPDAATSETWLLLDQSDFDIFAFESKRDEKTLAATLIIGGKAS